MPNIRNDNELPEATAKWGWKYHHLGIPTSRKMPDEIFLAQFAMYVSGFSTSPFGIEWMRFLPESQVDKLIQTTPHLAFEVDDLEMELARCGCKILTQPNQPSNDVRVAMIEHRGAPIELIEFKR